MNKTGNPQQGKAQQKPKQPTQQELEQMEKELLQKQIQAEKEKRVFSVEQQVKNQEITSVEQRALTNVFEILCDAKNYFKKDENQVHNSDDDDEESKQIDSKSQTKNGFAGGNSKRQSNNNNENSRKNGKDSNNNKNNQQLESKSRQGAGDGVKGKVVMGKHFGFNELKTCFNSLNYQVSNDQIREMIWEIDEDNTGCITNYQFLLMYKRCRFDESTYEPRTMYNAVQFLMYIYNDLYSSSGNRNKNDDQELENKQKEVKTHINYENTLEILYVIYGRKEMTEYTELIFGQSEQSGQNEVQISMTEYMNTMRNHDIKTRNNKKTEKKRRYPPPPENQN